MSLGKPWVAVITVCIVAVAIGWAQQPSTPQEAEPVIKVDVDLVNILCSVRDKDGRYINTLNKEDFTVLENGKQQELRYFTRESDLPLTIGLLVDVSKSQENLIEVEKRAALQFFRQMLRQKKDMAFLMSFGHEAELLQDFTDSARLLQQGLDDLKLSVPVSGPLPGPVPSSRPVQGTILYDAVYLASTEKLAREVGRKVIVVITDGMDYGSRVSLAKAIESAHRSDAIIYGIYYTDPGAYGGFGGSDRDLMKMSEETGGRVFHVSRKNTLDTIFTQIQEEMRSQYALGYSSNNTTKGFRELEIRTSDRKLKVQARKGYFAE
jgi:VWFA-related protein